MLWGAGAEYFGICLLLFFLFAFIKTSTYVVPKNFVEINGLKIPLGKCIDGNRRVIPDKKEREEYCKCFIEKIINTPELKSKYKTKLENDRINHVFKEIQDSPEFQELGIEECMTSIKMRWTDNIANSMKRNWKKELEGTDFEETNYLEKYCDCLIEEYRRFPLDSVLKESFLESKIALEIDEKCTEESKK